MKRWIRGSMVWLAAVALLAGCETENSVTGSFGDGVVVGQVVMAGELAGTSPAGVEVTVPELGMAMVLGADGRFVLSGIPGDAMIRFGRASDGIAASYSLRGSKDSQLVIELAKSTAKRGRTRPSRSPKLMQLEGTILEVGEGTLTMQAAGKGVVTVVVNDATSIRKGQRAVPFAELAVGDRIHVVAEPQTEGDPLARSIVLQNPSDDDEDDSDSVELEGKITAKAEDGSSLTVDAAGRGPTDVAVTETTVIRKGNRTLTMADLSVGDRIHVKAEEGEDGLVALIIMLQNPSSGKAELEGIILELGESGFRLDDASRGEVDVIVDASTLIRKGNQVLPFEELQEGDRVHVKASEETEEGFLAREIILQARASDDDDDDGDEGEENSRVELEGLILAISAESITVDAAGKGPTTATITGDTVIRKGNTSLTVDDLKEGDRVHVKADEEGEELIALEIKLQNPA